MHLINALATAVLATAAATVVLALPATDAYTVSDEAYLPKHKYLEVRETPYSMENAVRRSLVARGRIQYGLQEVAVPPQAPHPPAAPSGSGRQTRIDSFFPAQQRPQAADTAHPATQPPTAPSGPRRQTRLDDYFGQGTSRSS